MTNDETEKNSEALTRMIQESLAGFTIHKVGDVDKEELFKKNEEALIAMLQASLADYIMGRVDKETLERRLRPFGILVNDLLEDENEDETPTDPD